MLKLYGLALSNYYAIVKQSLLEKGIAFEEVPTPPSRKPGFLAKSPMGKIPCLETPDGFLSESLVILEFLEETHPVPKLFPADTFERAKAREIMSIATLYLDAPARRHLGHVLFGEPLSQAALDEARPAIEQGLAALKRVARYTPWVAGNDLSYADLVLFYCMRLVLLVARTVYQWNPLDEEPELAAWMARVEARDHSQSVLADQKQSLDALRAQQS